MYRVALSARIIRWPDYCACCCGPADTSVEITFTRVSGVKVVRTQTKGWRVPYCTRCLDHIRYSKRLANFGWLIFPRTTGVVLLAVLVLAGAVPLLLAMPAFFAVAFGAVWAAIFCFGFYALLQWSRRSYERALEERERTRRSLRAELNRCLCPSCSTEDFLAADYDGWSGSVHTFFFASREYANRFAQANAGKVVG